MHETDIDLGHGRIHYAEGPRNGRPLVLLHGGSARWQSWQGLLPDLTADFHVFALDLRGHGRSGWLQPYYLAEYAADVLAFLRRLAAPAIVCGHSLGGMAALMAAAQAGPAIRGVIIGDSPLSGAAWLAALAASRPRLHEWLALAQAHRDPAPIAAALRESPVELPGHERPLPAREAFGADSPWFAWMAENLAMLDPASLAVLLDAPERAASGYDLAELLPAIERPVCLLQADPAAGAMMIDEEVALAQRLSPWVRHQRLTGISHSLHATHPAEVTAALLGFCAQIERRDAPSA